MSTLQITSSPLPAISSGLAKIFGLLDTAVEYLMVQKDFQNAFETCERGLEHLDRVLEVEDSRYGELKASLCIVGIQALAELNQWRGVLGWVLQHYDCADKMPAKIMQMCILLYSKVGEHTTMQDAGHMWLHCPENSSVSGYATVAELYLLHVLIPLGLAEEAQRLVSEEVGNVAFTTEQRQVALDLLERQKQTEGRTPSSNPGTEEGSQMTTKPTLGPVVRKLLAMLRLLQSGISSVMTRWRFIPARRLLLAVLLLYLLLVRMDPALPSSFPWVFKLLGLLRQMWHAMFGPYYRANATA